VTEVIASQGQWHDNAESCNIILADFNINSQEMQWKHITLLDSLTWSLILMINELLGCYLIKTQPQSCMAI